MRRSIRRMAVWALVAGGAAPAFGQQWFFAWDGTVDPACAPTVEGANPFAQERGGSASLYWEIVDNGSGGKCLKTVDNNTTSQGNLRWKGQGSRPEFYRGPCTTFAMENFNPAHNAFTPAFRIKADSYTPGGTQPYKIKRIYNCEFETTTPNPFYNPPTNANPYYTYRVEFGLQKDASGNIWLVDFRYGDNNSKGEWNDGGVIRNNRIVLLKTAAGQAAWHAVWCSVEMPPGLGSVNSIYRCWADGTEVYWHDRDKGGWSDCEIGWDGAEQTAVVSLDYICYTYAALAPNAIPVPADQTVTVTPTIAQARALPEGRAVQLDGKVVTAVFTDPRLGLAGYYLAEPDGSDGIRVRHNNGLPPRHPDNTPAVLQPGDIVDVTGGMMSPECEKQISAHDIVLRGRGAPLPPALPVTQDEIAASYAANLLGHWPPQVLEVAETGTITAVTETSITDASRNWPIDRWKHHTVIVPANDLHGDLYYYIFGYDFALNPPGALPPANTADTLRIDSRVIRFNPPTVYSDGVRPGDTYVIVGGLPAGTALDGLTVEARGVVTALHPDAGNPAGQSFDLDDGGGAGDTFTVQDIWSPLNLADFTPPVGVRVYWPGSLPAAGAYVRVTGLLGAERFRKQVSTDFSGSVRDEVRIDKVMPVIRARSWSPPPAKSPDFDGDGDVDQADFAVIQACRTSPGISLDPDCERADLNRDSRVDGPDVDIHIGCASGPAVAWNPGCMP